MRTLTFAAAVLLSLALFALPAFGGVGLSPASVDIENMMRGGYAERYLTVSNPTDDAMTLSVSVDGPISGWVTSEPQSVNITGIGYRIIKIAVRPPNTIPNGVYRGELLVVARPQVPPIMEGGSSVSVASLVIASASVQITDVQLLRYNVESVTVDDTEECRPIIANINLRNTGNVNVTPRFAVEIRSRATGEVLQKYEEKSGSTLPTQTASAMLKVPYKLEQFKCIPEGLYTAHIVSYEGGSIMDTSDLSFRIYPRGTLTVGGEIMRLDIPNNATLGEIIKIGGVFKNTGQIPVTAKLNAEIYSGGRLVNTVSSDPTDVITGGVSTLTAYFTPTSGGKYRILASAVFEEKSTETVQGEVDVQWPPTYWLLAGIAVVAILAALYFFKFRKSK